MDPIGTFSGIASGIQWRDMVDQIISLEASRKLTPLTKRVGVEEKRREAWNSYNGLLAKLSGASASLRDASAFGVMRTSVTNSAGKMLLSATASDAAAPGSYTVEVVSLARAEKLSGGSFASTTEARGITGSFHLNGKQVELSATDTLVTIRDRINAANTGSSPSGVSATILSTSPTEHRLVLTSAHTGARGIEMVDGSSEALKALGIATGAQVQNTGTGGTAQTQRFASDTTPLATMLGLTAPPVTTTIVIGGEKVEVNLETDTLLSVMNRVNTTAGLEGSASLVKETVGSTTFDRLSVAGAVAADPGADDPSASQRIVELLGFTKPVTASPITSGADAVFEIDGFRMSRRTNTVSDAIAGVTLSLQVAEEGSPATVEVTRNPDATVQRVQEFANAYNELVKFVDSQRQPGSALYANGALRSMQSSLTNVFLNGVTGLSAGNPYTHASIVGVTLSKAGTLEIDVEKLKSTLASNPADVRALFATGASTTDAELSFVSAEDAAKPGSYAVVITAPATRASHLGAAFVSPYDASDGVSDVLTLTDSFSGKTKDFTVQHGKTAAEIASELNAFLAAEKMSLSVTEVGGALRFEAAEHGSARTFTVAGAAASRLGLTESTFAGTDVQGTIGGLAATGSGRVLTGAAGGATEGLAVRYTGETARAAGTVSHVLGVGGGIEAVVRPLTRAGDGVIVNQLRSIDSSIESLNRRADDAERRIELRREALIRQFALMEAAMSQVQSQSNWLNSQIQSMQPRK